MGRDEQEKAFVDSLDPKGKRRYVRVSLEEIEATRRNIERLGMGINPATLKAAKRWVEMHKRLLRLMGHKKRVVFKFPKPQAGKASKVQS
jgi:hypothetical protein